MARRFFVDNDIVLEKEFEITGEEAKHIMILRYNVGEEIIINDKICEIKSINKQKIICKPIKQMDEMGIPNLKITLYQALLKSDKMEFVIQKAVELGVSKIVPFTSKNVVVKLDDKDKIKKNERWNKISVEATKQCGRSDIVKVEEVHKFDEIINELNKYEKSFLAYEGETSKLKDAIRENLDIKEIAIVIGAEGGFEEEEVERFINGGKCISVSLGDRILRAETASLNLLSILMYELN